MTVKIPESMIGPWLDGHFGWHTTYMAIDSAQTWGLGLSESDVDFVQEWKRWRNYDMKTAERADFEADGNEEYIETLRERATDHLNSIAPDGTEFCWDMDEFSLLCKCQIEGNEEYGEIMENGTNHCERGWH